MQPKIVHKKRLRKLVRSENLKINGILTESKCFGRESRLGIAPHTFIAICNSREH